MKKHESKIKSENDNAPDPQQANAEVHQPQRDANPTDGRMQSADAAAGLTVEKYIRQLRQKDEKINSLEEENKRLNSLLLTKSKEHKVRMDEVEMELERHADLVTKLQSELTVFRKRAATPVPIREPPPAKKTRRAPPKPAAAKSQQQRLQSVQPIVSNSADDICAKLQSFVERNSQQQSRMAPSTSQQQQQAGSSSQNEDELITEQLVKLMAADPSLLPALLLSTTANGVDGLESEESASSLLSLLLESSSAGAEPANKVASLESGHEYGAQDAEKSEPIVATGATTTQQNQQNLDFEEVMQRVIGDAMNGAGATSTVVAPPNGRGSRAKSFTGAAAPNPASAGKAGKQKTAVAPVVAAVPVPAPAAVGTPLALPVKSPSATHKKSIEATKSCSSLNSPPTQVPHLPAAPHTSSSTAKPFSPEEQKLVNELEARIDQNIVELGPAALNTAELAIQCTRMMREYSIGQRLFARTVMCKVSQSQGSLSELLSKPRPWHKLTDKGRDAFRRIFGWISDDAAIELLCQLSPRKVTLSEKIVHPEPASLLGDSLDGSELATMLETGSGSSKKSQKPANSPSASSTHSLKTPKTERADNVVVVDASGKQPANATSAAECSSASTNGGIAGSGRWRHDDIPKEKIINIYEAEKAKLMEQESNLGSRSVGLFASSEASDANSSRVGSISPSRGCGGGGIGQLGKTRQATTNSSSNKSLDDLIGRSPSTLSATSSALGGDQATTTGNVDGLLLDQSIQQRKAFSQSAAGSNAARIEPFPIAQSQIERYSVLDTEEVVRQVKEFLAKNAVSQRQFGESVLGLSQGSVSDLLARPKAWQALQRKGREPYIRMHIFLEQYKDQVAKDGEKKEDVMPGADGVQQEVEEETAAEDSNDESELNLELPLEEEEEGEEQGNARSEIDDHLTAIGETEDSEKLLQQILAHIKCEQQQTPADAGVTRAATTSKATTSAIIKTEATQPQKQQPPPPITSEAAAMDEIDTADVSRRVKECLSKSGISQRAFGEHILKMTSGCVSDLLTKPKPWVMLGWKQRQSYSKMLEFLTDPDSMDRLRADEHHRCEMNSALNALKAIAGAAEKSGLAAITESSTGAANSKTSPPAATNASSMISRSSASSTLQIVTNLASELANTPIGTILKKANSPKPPPSIGAMKGQQPQLNGHIAHKRKQPSLGTVGLLNGGGPTFASLIPVVDSATEAGGLLGQPLKKIPRFQRTLITEKQKEALLFIFAHEQRPNSRCIEQLALKLGLTPRTVTNWFHNYRTRQKAKEIKPEFDDFVGSTSAPLISTPTPTQVLARALNATDSGTSSWFRELADLLRSHSSDASYSKDSIGNRSSVGTVSAESSPPSPQNHHASLGMGNEEDNVVYEEVDGSVYGQQSEDRAQSCGASSSASVPSPHQQTVSNGRQLDRVIARMHSRLAATGIVQ